MGREGWDKDTGGTETDREEHEQGEAVVRGLRERSRCRKASRFKNKYCWLVCFLP